MRDVAYFLQMSCAPEMLQESEKSLYEFYLDNLKSQLKLQKHLKDEHIEATLDEDDLWLQVKTCAMQY